MSRVLLLLTLFAISCSSPYLRNRGRDALDIFTVEFQTRAYGASVRAGPVKAGLYHKSADGAAAGLRGGDLGVHHDAEFAVLFFGADYFQKKPLGDLETPSEEDSKTAEETDPSQTALRGKEFRARSPFGTTQPAQKKRSVFKKKGGFAPASYYTQLEVSLGIFFGVKLGINPGELLDALLGWTTLDIFRDDEPFETEQEKALRDNPLYDRLTDEQRQKLKEQMAK